MKLPNFSTSFLLLQANHNVKDRLRSVFECRAGTIFHLRPKLPILSKLSVWPIKNGRLICAKNHLLKMLPYSNKKIGSEPYLSYWLLRNLHVESVLA